MKTVNKILMSVVAVLGLGLAMATVHAQPGPRCNGSGQGMMWGGGMHCQSTDHNNYMKVMRDLMTPAERLALMDKMIDAKTIEERQEIMAATHAEIEKRAKEKGIALPPGNGPQKYGRGCR